MMAVMIDLYLLSEAVWTKKKNDNSEMLHLQLEQRVSV